MKSFSPQKSKKAKKLNALWTKKQKAELKESNTKAKMIMTRSLTKMMNTLPTYSHPALAEAPEVKFIIAYGNGGAEGYLTFEDAYGDLEYHKFIYGDAWIFKAKH